jgi:intraflagellar transport protein 56
MCIMTVLATPLSFRAVYLTGTATLFSCCLLRQVVYYLKHGAVEEAYELMRSVEVVTPAEYIIKAVVFASMGQRTDSLEQLRVAQQHYKVVGASPAECDTIPGRQCMASFLYLKQSFEEVNVYLNSIKVYMDNDDDFNWNYGISLASTGNFKAAEEALCSIQNERYKRDYDYLSWLARCYIMNKNPRSAWELYLKLDDSQDSFNLLLLIANDCYKMGLFVYAAKAFDVLERLDPDPEYSDGKRGAFVGVFQQVVAGKASRDELQEVMQLFRATISPQVTMTENMIGCAAAVVAAAVAAAAVAAAGTLLIKYRCHGGMVFVVVTGRVHHEDHQDVVLDAQHQNLKISHCCFITSSTTL